jgi:peptide/nickel transport system substrate-binding protein
VGATGRAGGIRRARRAWAAVIVLVAVLALMAAPGATAQEQPAGKVSFTVGITTDIDSLNPFIGIVAEAYEV